MGLLHTADWQFGRLFHSTSLIDPFVDLAKSAKPDGIVNAGDRYDRVIPPLDAVALLPHVLTRLVLEQELLVILIAGNHESPLRLPFGSRLAPTLELHVYGMLCARSTFMQMLDEFGDVCFEAMPFAQSRIGTPSSYEIRSCNL